MKRTLSAFMAALAAAVLSGCVGINSNSDLFLNDIDPGMPEVEMLQTYGTPAFAGFADDQKVYTYKVRDNKYIILVGIYEGYDIVVTCEGGEVVQVDKVERPSTFSLFSPLPWAEGVNN